MDYQALGVTAKSQTKLEEIEMRFANISIHGWRPEGKTTRRASYTATEQNGVTPVKGTAPKNILVGDRSPKQMTQPKLVAPASASSNTDQGSLTKVCGEATGESDKRSCLDPETRRKPRRRRPPIRLSSGFVQNEKDNNYVRTILNEAVGPVSSQAVQKFSSWANKAKSAFDVIKLAEGSYGEVFKLRIRDDVCRQPVSKSKLAKLLSYGEGVFKIVPLRAQQGAGSKKFTTVDEITAEVKLLKLMDPIPGFARFREVHVVQGRFPDAFQTAWMTYKRTQDDCFNPNPASKTAYPDSQLWAILEMDDAGMELEKFSWTSAFQIYDIFWGVAMALARAEEHALFEVSFQTQISIAPRN